MKIKFLYKSRNFNDIDYGDGYGSGFGDGYKIEILQKDAIKAYHYIQKKDNFFILRNGEKIKLKQKLYEPVIKLCEYGLHASLCIEDAKTYKSSENCVLTKVKVWGEIIFSKDKLVATNRQIVEVLDET